MGVAPCGRSAAGQLGLSSTYVLLRCRLSPSGREKSLSMLSCQSILSRDVC